VSSGLRQKANQEIHPLQVAWEAGIVRSEPSSLFSTDCSRLKLNFVRR